MVYHKGEVEDGYPLPMVVYSGIFKGELILPW